MPKRLLNGRLADGLELSFDGERHVFAAAVLVDRIDLAYSHRPAHSNTRHRCYGFDAPGAPPFVALPCDAAVDAPAAAAFAAFLFADVRADLSLGL